MRARDMLNEYLRLRKAIVRLRSQIEDIKEQAESLSSWSDSDKVQSWHDPDKIGRVIAKLSDLEEERNDLILEAADKMNVIEELLRELDNPDYSLVLQYRYVRGLTWVEVADEMHYCREWVIKLNKRAIRALDEKITE